METHRLALIPGFRLDNFQIERILGKGGFGITYVALDLHLGKRVAIKELLPDSIATRVEGSTVVPQTPSMQESWEWARARFLEEAQILANFSHPAIVGVHRLIEANGTVYIVMDFVDGESYESRLRRIGRETDQETLMEVIAPILDGLQQVHSKNLLHRDIKPENILLSSSGQPVLIDFGSARTSIGATMSMTSIVTHGYSPIEQYQTKGRMGPWTDIYAMGAVMCRAITGEKPPVAADRLMADDFEWLSYRSVEGFSPAFLRTVDWALRLKPEERPPSILEWREQWNAKDSEIPRTSNSFTSLPATSEASLPLPIPEVKTIKTEPLSIWSLVLGILSIIGCSVGGVLLAIPAVLCGHFGIAAIKKHTPRNGYGLAVAGLVLGYVVIGLTLVSAIFFYSNPRLFPKLPAPIHNESARVQEATKKITQSTIDPQPDATPIEDVNPKKTLAQELFNAHGFIVGQNFTLESIAKKFPDLANDVKISRLVFESSPLGGGADELDKILQQKVGEKWPETKEHMAKEISDLLVKQELTKNQAVDFVLEVRKRAKGNLQEETRSTLLSVNPKYQENPGLELNEGWKQTFRTKGHPKSKGVDFSLSFPSSWKKREGYRPNIIQVFQSGAGHGPILCNIMVKDLPLPAGYKMTQDDIKEFFQTNELKEMVPEGAIFVDAKSLFLEGAPAGMLVCDQIMQRLDVSLKIRSTQFITISNNVMIFIQFSLNQYPDSKESLDELQKKYLPTYREIANTLVINDKYIQ
jgi:serine/threonine protein kinase